MKICKGAKFIRKHLHGSMENDHVFLGQIVIVTEVADNTVSFNRKTKSGRLDVECWIKKSEFIKRFKSANITLENK